MLPLQTVLVGVLTFVSVLCLGGAVLTVRLGRRQTISIRLQGPGSSLDTGGTSLPLPLRAIKHIGQLVSGKGPSSGLRRRLVRAGFHGRASASLYFGAQLLCLFLGLAGAGTGVLFLDISTAFKGFIVIGAGGLCFLLPSLYLDGRGRRRSTEVRMHLPDMVDLLEVCVSGGMGLDMAWNSVSEEILSVSPLLADEMALTNLELHLGEERGNAIRHMADRTGADDLTSLVAVLVQSQRFGTSVSEALRTFATNLREMRSQRAEESAEKMAVKMLFPMIVFIFPVVIIVAVGPAVVRLMEIFGT